MPSTVSAYVQARVSHGLIDAMKRSTTAETNLSQNGIIPPSHSAHPTIFFATPPPCAYRVDAHTTNTVPAGSSTNAPRQTVHR